MTALGHYLAIIARLAIYAVALLCLYVAAFLTEDEENRLQNKLEEWWLRLDAGRSLDMSRSTGFLRKVASTTSKGFDLMFGPRAFSLR
jgi:hypothetical protein